MSKFYQRTATCYFIALLTFTAFNSAYGQPLQIKDFVLFGKEGVQLGTSSNVINGGKIGSYSAIRSTGSVSVNSNMHSGGIIQLGNNNSVTGDITASNDSALSGYIFQVGSNASLNGSITVKGDISIQGGSVSGPVSLSGNYSGPTPTTGQPIQTNSLSLPTLPSLPVPLIPYSYTSTAATVVNTGDISPGAYAGMALTGGKTVTFKGTGDYRFGSILNTGNFNKFVFDFQGRTDRVFRIFVDGNVDLYKINVDYVNLPLSNVSTSDLAARLIMQVSGDGVSTGGYAWSITNGASGNNQSTWLGTVIAQNGNIHVGSGSSLSKIIGALLSNKSVTIESGVSITYVSLIAYCNAPTLSYTGSTTFCAGGQLVLNSSSNTGNQWTLNGAAITGATGQTYTVTSSGAYSVVVSGGCTTSSVNVTVNPLPTITGPTAVCVGGTISLTGSGTAASSTPWVSSNTTVATVSNSGVVTGKVAGTTTITYTNSNGCRSSVLITVNAIPSTPTITVGGATTFCLGDKVLLTSSATSGNQWYLNGVIISNANGATYTATQAGGYSVRVTINNCTSAASNTVTITINNPPAPIAAAGGTYTFTCPTPGIDIGTINSSGSSYTWRTTVDGVVTVVGSTKTITATSAGTYTLTVSNVCGTTATDVAIVNYVSCVDPITQTPDGKVYNLIGSELTYLTTNLEEARNYLVIFGNDSVLIEAVAKVGYEQAARQYLYDSGMRDTIPNGINPLLITGKFPIAKLLSLNSADAVAIINHIRPVFIPLGNTGLVTSAGDTSINAYLSRAGFNISGEGIKIGVLSDSYNTDGQASTDVFNDDLPGVGNIAGNITPVQVIYDYPWGNRSNEGRAMLQIVHDLAPKSELAFRTGFVSAGDFAYGILQLKDAGCKVIVDDVTYITEPFFKDGIVSQAVDIATSQNVLCITSAGNFGQKSYTHAFTPYTIPGTSIVAHDFSGTGDVRQRLKLKRGQYTIVLQWQDDVYSLGTTSVGTLNDLDIYLYDPSGRTGFNRNNIGGDPLEVLSFSIDLPDDTSTLDADLMIVKAGTAPGAVNPTFKYIIFRGSAVIDEYYSDQPLTDKSTIVGHANSANALAIGAVLWSNTPPYGVAPTIASFSSIGGTPIYTSTGATIRRKPELTAPNGVNTSRTVNMGPDNDGSGHADGFPNFFGTSAAAPHAAAVAALVLEARHKYYDEFLTPNALKYYLFNTAITMQPDGLVGGTNFKAGYGLIQPDLAIRSFANPTPHINDLVYDASITPGTVPFTVQITGDYISSSSVIYFRGEPIETVVNSTLDTLTAAIDPFTGNPPINVFTPSYPGSVNENGGLSNTLYFFAAKKDTVTIIADSKTKLYGESLPPLTTTILFNGDTLENYNASHGTNITRADLGVDDPHLTIRYSDPTMNAMTNVGTYQIRASRSFDTTNLTDVGYLERYVYDSTFGNLQINKLGVTVQARDTIIEYGAPLTNFHFNYLFDATANLANTTNLTNVAIASHQEHMVNALALMNSTGTGDIVIYNGQLLNVFTMPSVTIDGKLYPVVNGTGGTAVVILNTQNGPVELPVVNGTGGTAVVILNGQQIPVTNGTGGTAVVLLNGQMYPVQFNSTTGDPYIRYNGADYNVTNGTGGTAVVILNGEEKPVLNGTGGTAVVLLNHEYYAVVNGTGGTAVILLNGQELPVVNGTGGTAVVLLNGQEYPVVNGTGGTAVVILNGEAYPVVNGTGGTAVILLNGQEIPVTNGTGGTAVVLLNGQEYPVVNGTGGTAVVLLNGEMHPVLNGTGGTAVVLLNDQQIPVLNGTGGTAVVILNGEVYPVTNGTGGTAVILLNGQEIPVTNGTGGTAVVLLNGEAHPVVNSISKEALTNVSALASTNAVANARLVNSTAMIDVAANAFVNFTTNSLQAPLLNSLPLVNSRGMLNVAPIANGTGGTAVILLNNGSSVPVLNGSDAYVNSSTINTTSSIVRTPVIVDEADVNSANSTGATITMDGVNMITGLNAGEQYLVPATLLNPNFEIKYLPGKVTITKAPLALKANDASKVYGNTLTITATAFTTQGTMKYYERIILASMKSAGTTATATAGNYPIVPSNALGAFGTDAGNYSITYVNGTLTVGTRSITVTADATSKTYGDADPSFTYKVTGGALVNGDTFSGTLNRNTGENVGNYLIKQGTLTAGPSYSITYVGNNLTINKAPLQVKADDKSKVFGSNNPSFTATLSGFKFGQALNNSGVTGSATFSTTATATSAPGTYTITVAAGSLAASNYYFSPFVPGILTITENSNCILTHSKFTSIGSTATVPTALWVNIEIKVSGQLVNPGDYISFSGGKVTFTNINATPAVNDVSIKNGMIIADISVTAPTTSFDISRNMFITKIPVGFSSTSDIFITGGILTSSTGFITRNNSYSTLKGAFYSNVSFSDQWSYALAAYQKDGGYVQYSDLNGDGSVVSSNGDYKAGTPLPWLQYIASGGSGNGGNNYTGSSSSQDKFSACASSNYLVNSGSTTEEVMVAARLAGLEVYPNPASSYATISFVPSVTGNSTVTIYSINGSRISEIYNGLTEAGRTYNRRIETRSLPGGVYLIQFREKDGLSIKKLIINNK